MEHADGDSERQFLHDGAKRVRIYLVRHGQAASRAADGALYGNATTLTAKGVQEAHAMRDFLRTVKLDAAYCSPIERARETSAIVLQGREIVPAVSEAFREIEGSFAAVIEADQPLASRLAGFAYSMWTAGEPGARFFGGDIVSEFRDAAGRALGELAVSRAGQCVLVVSHSGFIRAALSWAAAAPVLAMAAFEQDTCSVGILDIDVGRTAPFGASISEWQTSRRWTRPRNIAG